MNIICGKWSILLFLRLLVVPFCYETIYLHMDKYYTLLLILTWPPDHPPTNSQSSATKSNKMCKRYV